jgi:hypothetical protein
MINPNISLSRIQMSMWEIRLDNWPSDTCQLSQWGISSTSGTPGSDSCLEATIVRHVLYLVTHRMNHDPRSHRYDFTAIHQLCLGKPCYPCQVWLGNILQMVCRALSTSRGSYATEMICCCDFLAEMRDWDSLNGLIGWETNFSIVLPFIDNVSRWNSSMAIGCFQ